MNKAIKRLNSLIFSHKSNEGMLHEQVLATESHILGAGHSRQFSPYLPSGQTHWLLSHRVVGNGQSQVFMFSFHTLGLGHTAHYGPYLSAGQTHLIPFQTEVGSAQSKIILTIFLELYIQHKILHIFLLDRYIEYLSIGFR